MMDNITFLIFAVFDARVTACCS